MKKEGSEVSESRGDIDSSAKRNIGLIKKKIFVDKVGAGFSSIQFLNILFSFTGASFLMIGLVNAVKSALNTITSSIVKKKSEENLSSDLMIVSGLFFGFSFLFIALGVSLKWKWLFAASLVIGSVFFVIHGDMFQIFLERYMKKFKPGIFGGKVAFTGTIVIALAILLSAFIMENISFTGEYFNLPLIGKSIFYGYLLSFEVAAFAFILSSYLLMRVNVVLAPVKEGESESYRRGYFADLKYNASKFCKNKYLFTLAATTVFVGAFQAIMNSFLGIYVYNEYQELWLGGFLNVGIMLALSLIIVILGPYISGRMSRNFGVVPLFVFGTLLMALLPFVIIHNNYFPAVVAANMLSVLGAAMIGSGHNIVAVRLLNEKDRESYYTSAGVVSLIPFMFIVGILSFLAQQKGLLELFNFVWIGIIACLFPLYFMVVLWISGKKKVN